MMMEEDRSQKLRTQTMERWKELGVVDTIYEEEIYDDYSSISSPSLSPSLSSPSSPLHSTLESWSIATGRATDVLIYVQGRCFHLHKDPLAAKSTYLKRQLTELSEITLPFNITAETFSLVADFCYGAGLVVTPFNVAALRTAAELLGMTETYAKRDENLRQVTEAYFRRVVTVKRELAPAVFRSCMRLLPEAETAALLVSRCLEAMDLRELDGCVDDVMSLVADDFQIVADALQCTLTCHDVLYRLVDLYIKEHSGKITEEQKTETCSLIDCEKLSPDLLIHAVQNPSLPLRFIVRAMFMEQLNTRRAILTSTTNHHHSQRKNIVIDNVDDDCEDPSITLGSILRRDAALREALQLKTEMDATNSRIESLEKELSTMKKLLVKCEKDRSSMDKKLLEKSLIMSDDQKTKKKKKKLLIDCEAQREGRRVMESSRSASFHYGSTRNIIEKGERGSSSFTSSRFGFSRGSSGSSSLSNSSNNNINNNISKKKINGKGLISMLKSTLWVSKLGSKSANPVSKEDGNGLRERNGEDIVVTEDDVCSHKKSLSLG